MALILGIWVNNAWPQTTTKNNARSMKLRHGRAILATWWRHQMETFSALLAFCAGNSPVTGEFPGQRPVTRSFDVTFYLRPNKPLSKQSWGWWFETLSCSSWRHCNASTVYSWNLHPSATAAAVTMGKQRNMDPNLWAYFVICLINARMTIISNNAF